MSWLIHLHGATYSSLDLTLDEVEAMERLAAQPWPLLNPMRNITAAKAYLAVFMLRDGSIDDATIMDKLGGLTMADLVGAFEFVDDPAPAVPAPKGKRKGKALDPTNGAATSRRGLPGEPNGTAGPPTPAAGKG